MKFISRTQVVSHFKIHQATRIEKNTRLEHHVCHHIQLQMLFYYHTRVVSIHVVTLYHRQLNIVNSKIYVSQRIHIFAYGQK